MNQIINHKNKYYLKTKLGYKEIISSTDILLELPQPSKEFIQAYIKAYNEGKPINRVLVEYESTLQGLEDDSSIYADMYFLKINSSNEITINKIKENYTKEDFINALHKVELIHSKDYSKLWKEIEENL